MCLADASPPYKCRRVDQVNKILSVELLHTLSRSTWFITFWLVSVNLSDC